MTQLYYHTIKKKITGANIGDLVEIFINPEPAKIFPDASKEELQRLFQNRSVPLVFTGYLKKMSFEELLITDWTSNSNLPSEVKDTLKPEFPINYDWIKGARVHSGENSKVTGKVPDRLRPVIKGIDLGDHVIAILRSKDSALIKGTYVGFVREISNTRLGLRNTDPFINLPPNSEPLVNNNSAIDYNQGILIVRNLKDYKKLFRLQPKYHP